MKALVLCGGYGTKLWPASRKSTPKQFMIEVNGKTLFRTSIEILLKKFKPNDIFLVTSLKHKKFLKKQAPEISESNFILEPTYKNQGAVTILAVTKFYTIDPDEPFTTVQSDVLRIPWQNYLKTLTQTEKIVKEEEKLVTGGARPGFPRMGVDYIRLGKRLTKYKGIKANEQKEFLGRTTYKSTVKLINDRNVVMHANQLSWTPRLFVQALHEKVPEWGKTADKFISLYSKKRVDHKAINKVFSNMREGPIEDLTKLIQDRIVIITINYNWIDFGTWDSIYQYMKVYKPENVNTNYISIDSKGNFIRAPQNKVVATIGLEGIAIIDTKDALLVCPLNRSGEVDEVVKRLEQTGKEQYL